MRPDRDRFVATTSSSHTAHVLSHLEFYRDTAWAGRPIALSDVTEAWSVIIVAGPQSRTTLAAVLGNPWPQTLSAQRHMDVIDGSYSGASLRVMRASFSGELAFELHCEPTIASRLWQSLVAAGLAPFGLEALDVLRVEKGYLTTSELNGQTTPADLRLERMLRAATDAVGKSMLDRPAFKEPERPILVGLRAIDGSAKFLGGAQLTRTDDPGKSVGYVTSAVFSPALGQWVGLALVARGLSEPATTLVARDPLRGGDTPVLITQPTHFDPTGERLRA
jgi:sarcosine oxidase subunit alpha